MEENLYRVTIENLKNHDEFIYYDFANDADGALNLTEDENFKKSLLSSGCVLGKVIRIEIISEAEPIYEILKKLIGRDKRHGTE